MTLWSDLEDAARRVYIGITRGTHVKADDTKKLQELTIRDRFGDTKTNVEHWLPYGRTYHPLPPKDGQEAEVLISYVGGSPDHPIVVATVDRRSRPKNLQPGETAHHDDQGQYSKIGRDGHHRVARQHTMTAAGDGVRPGGLTKPDTTFDLNEQLKGLRAEITQLKDSHHSLFDVVSKLRVNAESVVPALAPVNLATQVTTALNGLPAGLDTMKSLATAKLQGYFQTAAQQALTSFLDPSRLTGVASLLSGGVEAAIQAAKSEITSLMSANPVVAKVDDTLAEIAGIKASQTITAEMQKQIDGLQAQANHLISSNPIVKQVMALRDQLQSLTDQAGPGLNFLEPQKRLVQGITKSLKLAQTG